MVAAGVGALRPGPLVALGTFGVCLTIAILCHGAAACGVYAPDPFGGALFLLQSIYAALGLIPYLDYGFLYPPGIAMFFGSLLHLADNGSVMKVVWTSSFILLSANVYVAARLAQGREWLSCAGVYFILGGLAALIWADGGGEPFSLWLLLLIVLLTVQVLRSGISPVRLLAVGLASTALALVRWDRALGLAGVEAALAGLGWGSIALLNIGRQHVLGIRPQGGRLIASLGATLLGIVAAFALIFWYTFKNSAWAEAQMFIFDLPVRILPFRTLPLPRIGRNFGPSSQWLTSIVAIGTLVVAGVITMLRSRKHIGVTSLSFFELGVLCAGPVALVPYAFGRADAWHFYPLTFVTCAAAMVAMFLSESRLFRVACAVGLVLSMLPVLQKLKAIGGQFSDGLSRCGHFERELDAKTAECTGLIPPGTRSIFVGQASYRRFILNWPILYLARADLRPATRFISDEPGVQNSCAYGSRIAADLMMAPRPMVAFLDMDPMGPEPNLTMTMQSCGWIERTLQEAPGRDLGTCQFIGHSIRARLYTSDRERE
jgi:hypothetical protein